MASLLSESGRQTIHVSHTAHLENFDSLIALSTKALPHSPPTLHCENSAVDQSNSATTSSPSVGVSSPSVPRTPPADQTTSAQPRPSKGANNTMQLNTQELDDDEEDERLRELKTDYERRREERKKEQDLAALERQRLEEIFRICSEYDQKQESRKDSTKPAIDDKRDSASSRSSWGSSMKIKTNGSLTSSVIYNRRSDDVAASSADNSVGDATKPSNGRTESKSYVINAPKPSNGDAVCHHHVTNDVTKPSNRIAEPDRIQSRPTETGSDCNVGKCYARILKLSSETLDIISRNKPNGIDARLSSKDSDVSDALEINLSYTDLSDGIDDDNISTDCFPEETSFSFVSSENSFQTASPTQNGNWNRYDGNRSVPFSPAEALSKRLEDKNSLRTSSESVLGQQSRENRFQKSVEDAKERIQILRLRIIDVKNLEEKTIKETQAELELLQWEYRTLIEQLQREKERMAVINHQQMELIFEAAKEREEAERQLESERRRLEELEERLEERRKRCLSLGIDPDDDVTLRECALGELIVKETEEVEHQRRLFDDLEFHLLEMETRTEEEREPHQRKLAAELNQLKHSCSLVEETLLQLTEQKSSLMNQIKSDVIDLEKERLLLMEDYRKERNKLLCLLNGSGVNLGISPNNHLSSSSASPLQASHYKSKAAQRVEGTEFNDDAVDWNEDFLPRTPSSTTSVLQSLQELERRDPAIQTFTENKDPGVSDGDDDLGVADDQSFLSSSFSVDRLKSWLLTDQSSGSQFRCPSGSDEGASVRSMEDDLDRLLLQSADRYSFGTGCSSSQSKEELNGKDSIDQSTNDGRHYVKNRRSTAAAEGLISGVWRWSRTVAGASTDNRSSQPMDVASAAGTVVMRTTPKVQSRPMTRYLPVRGSCDLDLRQFIESSGHRVDGNPHVHVTPSTCSGHLVKMGTKFRLWHRRWFVFDRTRRSVFYYADQSAKKVRGCVLFSAIEDVFVDHLRTVRSPSPKLTFCLKTTVKNFYLVAPSPETMRIWIDVLFTGAEGYQGFS